MKQLHLVMATLAMFLVADGLIMQEAYARRGSSRSSFSRSSSRSWGSSSSSRTKKKSSYSSGRTKKKSYSSGSKSTTKKKSSYSSSKKKSITGNNKTKKLAPTKCLTKKTSFQKKMSKKVSKKQSKASLSKYKASKAKFKKSPTPTSSTSYSKSSSYNSIRSSGNYDSRTYYTRRDSFYGGYRSPYMYNSYSSFGVYDSVMMWYMLDHLNESRYRNMYYHHRNTSGFRQFRGEADRLGAENAELRAKLNNLDGEVNKLKKQGVKENAGYIPEGVDADLLLSDEAVNSLQPTFNLCTGPSSGNYNFAGRALAIQSGMNIEVVTTSGSSDNLNRISKGECDGAFVQNDALTTNVTPVETTTVMYPEFGHLICSKSAKVKNITSLKSGQSVAIGAQGSGSRITWQNLTSKYPNLNEVTTTKDGSSTALLKVLSSQTTCLFTVISLNSKFLDRVEKEKSLLLADIDSSDLTSIKDANGNSVYEIATIPKGVYPTLQGKKWFIFKKSTDTVVTRAALIVSKKWVEKNKEGYDTLSETLLSVKPKIDAHVDPEN